MSLDIVLTKADIVLIVNSAWKDSFGHVSSNKKAISQHGWNPLNRALLVHPEIIKTKPKVIEIDDRLETTTMSTATTTTTTDSLPFTQQSSLNFKDGYSGLIFTDVLQNALKEKCVYENLKKRYAKAKVVKNALDKDNNKRFSAGTVFKSGKVCLDNEILALQVNKWETQVRENKKRKRGLMRDG